MAVNKNQKLKLNIIDMNNDGYGIAKVDGEVVFVPYTLPGEEVEATIINTKNKFAIAKADRIISPSAHRVEGKCPYFGKCGGCSLQHLSYEKQLEFKTKLVKDTLKKFGNINVDVLPCVASPQWRYRNKNALPANGSLGMYRKNSHNVIEIEDCLIAQKWFPTLLKVVKDFIKKYDISLYDEEKKSGLIKHLVARSLNNQILITLVINGESLPHSDMLIKDLSRCFKNFGLNLNINTLNSNVIFSNKWKYIYGLKELPDCSNGIEYSISSASFMQINDSIKSSIYDKILSLIDNNDTVIDAYSGAGLLSAMISRKAKSCYGIEIILQATANADKLARKNNLSNLTNINGDCAVELPKLIQDLKDETTVVLDPPRKGCDKRVIDAISGSKPSKIIYLSCSPDTLARDLKNLLATTKYNIQFVQPYDMFPNTPHVETLVYLIKE